jgi:hypothetical protein
MINHDLFLAVDTAFADAGGDYAQLSANLLKVWSAYGCLADTVMMCDVGGGD